MEQLYYLEMDSEKSSWLAWQKGLYRSALQFNRQLFTKQQILALGHWLNGWRTAYRNHGDVSMPDWEFCEEYCVPPSIMIGPGCSLHFKPVAGYFNGK